MTQSQREANMARNGETHVPTSSIAHRSWSLSRTSLTAPRSHTPFTSPRSICPQVLAQTARLAPSATTIAADAITQIAKFLMPYQVHMVYGDRIGVYYTGDFGAKRLIYSTGDTEWSVPRKADNYLALLPLISSRSISLINNERIIDQLCSLCRRPMPGGYERIEASQVSTTISATASRYP